MPGGKSKKAATPNDVPSEGDPDRKRVLNVLAQRRYRQRRREKIATLEAQSSGPALGAIGPTAFGGDPEEPTINSEDSNEDMDLADLGVELELPDMSTLTSPMGATSMFELAQEPFEMSMFQQYEFVNLPTPIPSLSPSSTPPITADGAFLSVPILDILRTFASIATAFDVATCVWDPNYLHVLPPAIPGTAAALPPNLHPIPAQYNIPHHPFLDLLPWPGVREKLICMLAMPSKLRPPVAQEEDDDHQVNGAIKQTKAIMQLIQDLDENEDGLGIRVHSNSTTWAEGNELVEDAWEIGDLFYRKWWWCLDQKIVETSNRRRKERGLPRLRWIA